MENGFVVESEFELGWHSRTEFHLPVKALVHVSNSSDEPTGYLKNNKCLISSMTNHAPANELIWHKYDDTNT